MEEIEITSWLTLDAIKKKAEIVETVGNLQTGHSMSVFCEIEDDYLELVYSDAAANTIRRYEDRDEFDEALEERKEDDGEALFEGNGRQGPRRGRGRRRGRRPRGRIFRRGRARGLLTGGARPEPASEPGQDVQGF